MQSSKESFLQTLASMTPEEMADFISQKGKGPKVIEWVVWAEPRKLENNKPITH